MIFAFAIIFVPFDIRRWSLMYIANVVQSTKERKGLCAHWIINLSCITVFKFVIKSSITHINQEIKKYFSWNSETWNPISAQKKCPSICGRWIIDEFMKKRTFFKQNFKDMMREINGASIWTISKYRFPRNCFLKRHMNFVWK